MSEEVREPKLYVTQCHPDVAVKIIRNAFKKKYKMDMVRLTGSLAKDDGDSTNLYICPELRTISKDQDGDLGAAIQISPAEAFLHINGKRK